MEGWLPIPLASDFDGLPYPGGGDMMIFFFYQHDSKVTVTYDIILCS